MEIIETIFENYKASYNEETPQSQEQKEKLQDLEWNLETLSQQNPSESAAYQELFDTAIEMSRASEKADFVVGFKMAVDILHACRGCL